MKSGKLTNEELKKFVFDKLPKSSAKTIEGPGVGLDCAIIDCQNELLAISSDPVTGASGDVGRIAVNISCNDIACCGIKPIGIVLVIIAPTSATKEELERVISQAIEASKELDVEILGGHTEVSDAVNKFVLTTTAFGFSTKEKIIKPSGSKTGDTILMTKYAAMEGTAIIATDYEGKIKNKMDSNSLSIAKNLINDISVINEGVICGDLNVSAMHDATEGGIMGAVWEISNAANLGCELDLRKIPVLDQTKRISEIFDIDLYKLISSGSMIISTNDPQKAINELKNANILCTEIGKIVEKQCIYFDLHGQIHELLPPVADELYKVI